MPLFMLVKTIISRHRAVLLALLTVALFATGFTHRMPDASDQALAFAMANGATAADLCGDGLPGGVHPDADCLACQTAGAVVLPPALGDLQDLDVAVPSAVTAPRESRIVARVLDPSHAPQGPPAA